MSNDFTPEYQKWRHGGWYVTNIRYPSGACGCVSNAYPDKKWRIVCGDERTYRTRDAAAKAEYSMVQAMVLVQEMKAAVAQSAATEGQPIADPIADDGEGTQPDQALFNSAKEAWEDRAINNAETRQYLEDETWSGVLIGFLLGYGMTLDEAHWSLQSGEFEY